MDLSKEYILMCGKAEELQSEYSIPKEGDFIKCKHGLEIALDYTYINEKLFVNVDTDCFVKYSKDEFIWLPRQDQLQKMVCEGEVIPCFALHNWIMDNEFNYDLYKTEEQRWLAYVMKEKHNKTWNGKDWKKVKKKGNITAPLK